MTDRAKNADGIAGAVRYGATLASSLQMFAEMSSNTKSQLDPVLAEINAATSALRQVSETLNDDNAAAEKQGRAPSYTPEGLVEVHTAATQCDRIFHLIFALLRKAVHAKGKSPNVDGKSEPLDMESAADPGSLTLVTVLSRGLDEDDPYDWLKPRITRCQEQLQWLKTGLLMHLQLARLAKLHLDHGPRPSGAFDLELGFRASAERLRIRQLQIAKRVVKRMDRKAEAEESSSESDSGSDSDSESETMTEAEPKSASPLSASHVSASELPTEPCPEDPTDNAKSDAPETANAVEDDSASPPPEDAPAPPPPPYTQPTTSDTEPDFVMVEKPQPEPQSEKATVATEEPPKMEKPGLSTSVGSGAVSISAPSAFRIIPKWLTHIFGSSSPPADTTSSDLEAYIATAARASSPLKVPLGDERLKFGLKSLYNNKTSSAWLNYLDMSAEQRGIVDDVIKFARFQSPHVRTCVGVEEFKRHGEPSEYLIFLSLAEPLRPVSFKDCVGRKFLFPFEFCKNWDDMRNLIESAFLHVEIIGPNVFRGFYDLIINGDIVMPALWSSSIRPGDKVTMHMWPMNEVIPPPIGRPLGARPPMPPMPPMRGGGPPPPPPPQMPSGPMFPSGMPPPLPPPPPGFPGFPSPPVPGGFPGSRPFTRPPPGAEIIDVCPGKPPKRGPGGGSSVLAWMMGMKKKKDENEMTKDEEEELKVVDFRLFLDGERMKAVDMLKKWTNATDVENGIVGFFDSESSGSETDSDSDSDTDSTMSL
ncbi:hypothetical protein B0T16DRAFT_403014 [Cercophora newfieldiana]|uniref:Ubiquitin-like domain-containing protein n=1 Tax=Cercophora newfieldiana TaxID=92897 RepID=A0AA39YES2_9PEZI|nr:hypothetical protein B0T16DRAFT_403014 [Cercophora newfieldiana]